MTDKDLEALLKAMDEIEREHASTPEKARKFLQEEGILTRSGKLAKPYR